MEGYIYCFSNKLMPNLSKCGGTKRDPYLRCKELFNTSLPIECEVEYFIKVSDWKKMEKIIHKEILDSGFERCNKREWFKCNPEDIKHIFDKYNKVDKIINSEKSENKIVDNIIIEKPNIKNYKININSKYVCERCFFSTTKKFDYNRHLHTIKHKENTRKIFTCKNCEKIYKSKSGYYSHIKICKIDNKNLLKENNNTKTDLSVDDIEKEKIKHENFMIKKELEIEKIKNKFEKEKNKLLKDIIKNKNN